MNEIERIVSRLAGIGALGRGRPLAADIKSRMERVLGARLPEAQLHESENASHASRAMGARAFTIGTNIFAPPGALQTSSATGRALLAHELVHVSQAVHGDTHGMQHRTESPETATAGHEHVARQVESRVLARSSDGPDQTQESGPDPQVVADYVYRLMHRELKIDLERAVVLRR